jgi:hypothetical protein
MINKFRDLAHSPAIFEALWGEDPLLVKVLKGPWCLTVEVPALEYDPTSSELDTDFLGFTDLDEFLDWRFRWPSQVFLPSEEQVMRSQ